MFDLIIRGGMVVDGTGEQPFPADIGINDGKIEGIGDLSESEAGQELNASGFVVAPGFIDIHSHSDYTLLVDPRAQSAIAQGVTTELVGNCGHGCAPILDAQAAQGNIYGFDPVLPITWNTMDEYLTRLEQAGPGVNVLTLVPNGMLRLAAMDNLDRAASPQELLKMRGYLEEGMDAGALGFSVGLEYAIERACTTEEQIALCEVVATANGLFAPHLRNREVYALEAIEEALTIAKKTGVRLHIPHLTPRRGGPTDVDIRALDLIEQALESGVDVTVDMHTRLHGITNLSAALPSWAFEGGSEELRRRLRDQSTRADLRRYESLITSFALGGWEHVSLLKSASRPDLAGKSFLQIAEEMGTTPFDAILNVLLADADDPHAALVLCESYTEEQLQRSYQHPVGMVASDATTLCTDGPLADHVFHGAFTWVSWYFRRFVREEGVFSLEEAVQKLTALPARRLRLSDRGVLKPGKWADVVVFDPNTFQEHGTLNEPNQLAEGMIHVVVNGVVEIRDRAFTGNHGGRILRA